MQSPPSARGSSPSPSHRKLRAPAAHYPAMAAVFERAVDVVVKGGPQHRANGDESPPKKRERPAKVTIANKEQR